MGLFGNLDTLASGITGGVYKDFLSNGTWCKPAGLVCVDVIVIGAGGGGGGGSARCCIQEFPPYPPNYAIGAGGGGGGGISYFSSSAASLCSSYCVVVGQGGCAGAAAAANCQNGFAGGTGGASCFGPNIGWGGKGGAAGRNVICDSSCQITIGGAGGTGSTGATFTGQNGGCGISWWETGCSPTPASGGSGGGRGGGAGSSYNFGSYTGCVGSGGPTIKFCGIRLGCGAIGQGFPGTSVSLPYGSGGAGGNSCLYSGAACPILGAQGTQGIVRVIEYY